jgi:DTW domain-containing protein YfiP
MDIQPHTHTKRPYCPACDRAKAVCICKHLVPLENKINLIILRHPSETQHPLNTAKLLGTMLTQCTIYDGECFDDHHPFQQQLKQWQGPIHLVYPRPDAINVEDLCNKVPPPTHRLFILLDGTWRKTRRILHLSRCLNELPAVQLPLSLASRYRIRKGQHPGISTLEAAYGLLARLEQTPDTFQPLLQAMNAMIDQQIQRIDPDLFQLHYGQD